MKIDLHIHSISSGHALNTLDEIRAYATKTGMTHIAITDHGPAMKGGPHEGYFEVSEMVEVSAIKDLKVYMGIEANILLVSVVGLISTIVYILIALVLVYRYAPKTFKLN